MFRRSKTIVFLTDTALQVVSIRPGTSLIDRQMDFTLDETGLTGAFQRVMSEFGRRIRLVLPEKYLYVTTLGIDAYSSNPRTVIEQKILDVFPETLGSLAWDYMIIDAGEKRMTVEVSGVVHDFGEVLQSALTKTRLSIEALIPESHALAQLVPNDRASLLVHENEMGWIVAVIKEGKVITAIFLEHIPSESDMKELITFAQQRKEIHLEKVLLSLRTVDPVVIPALGLPCDVLDVTLNPAIGAAKIVLRENDGDRLDIPLRSIPSSWFKKISHFF